MHGDGIPGEDVWISAETRQEAQHGSMVQIVGRHPGGTEGAPSIVKP